MLKVHQRPLGRGRFLAEVEIEGARYATVSRRGAPFELARILVRTDVDDQPVAVTHEGLRGYVTYPSLATMAELTIEENSATPIRLTRFHGFGNGLPVEDQTTDPEPKTPWLPPRSVTHSEQGRIAVDERNPQPSTRWSSTPPRPSVTHASEEPAPTNLRRCEACGEDFVPKVKWQQFCRDACRVRAHRLRAELDVEERRRP